MTTASDKIKREFYRDHFEWLRTHLHKKLGCSHRAADIAQDTFIKVFTKMSDLYSIEQPRPYLVTIAARLVIDSARRHRVEREYLEIESAHAPDISPMDAARVTAEKTWQLMMVSKILQKLPEKPRRAFIMSQLEGWSHDEIATRLNVSVSMIKKYLSHVRSYCGKTIQS